MLMSFPNHWFFLKSDLECFLFINWESSIKANHNNLGFQVSHEIFVYHRSFFFQSKDIEAVNAKSVNVHHDRIKHDPFLSLTRFHF